MLANGNVPRPPWWQGTCDGAPDGTDPGSYRLGAEWDGLEACGPGPNEGGTDHTVYFYPHSWGEYEWECVELSMRWMYLAWGIPPYPANGDTIADNYATYNPDGPKLDLIQNGTKGVAPEPGDVLELNDGDAYGHTEVVTASDVNAEGNGTVRVITENLNSPTNGWYELSVSDWVVGGGFGRVVDWLHNPAWSLEEPLAYRLEDGTLSVQTDGIRGAFAPVATGVAEAEVVGSGGRRAAPYLVVLTDSGTLEIGPDLPDTKLRAVAAHVSSIAAASGAGAEGRPTIGWLTTGGDFYTVTGGSRHAEPVLQASGATSIAVAPGSPASSPLLGYVDASSRAFVRDGSSPFAPVATGVRELVLANDTASASGDIEGYVGLAGKAHVRFGLSGHFTTITPPGSPATITGLSVATVGPDGTPLIGYVTSAGSAYAELGWNGFVEESAAASGIEVAGASSVHGFPIVALHSSAGSWSVKDGKLTSRAVDDGAAGSFGIGTLVVT